MQARDPLTRLLTLAEVVKMTSLSRSSIYRLLARDEFPQPIKLCQRAVRWRAEDIDRWISK